VVLIENMGSEGQVIVDVDGREMSFVTKAFRTIEAGQRINFSIDPDNIHIFSRDDGRSLLHAAA
jgi:multiple sugar transport system ATP-binding protein